MQGAAGTDRRSAALAAKKATAPSSSRTSDVPYADDSNEPKVVVPMMSRGDGRGKDRRID
jgi:hypothetical protein